MGASGRRTTTMKFLVTAGCPRGQRPVRPGLRGVSAPSPAVVAVTAVWMGPTRSWRPRGAYPRAGVDVAADTGRRPACVGRGNAADRRVAAAATRAEPVRASRPLPAAVCGRRGADVAEGQLTAERMGDGRAGSGRPPSWFGELAKRRTSRFGAVAALPSPLAASAAVGTEPTERDFVPSHARADRDRCVRPTPGTALMPHAPVGYHPCICERLGLARGWLPRSLMFRRQVDRLVGENGAVAG